MLLFPPFAAKWGFSPITSQISLPDQGSTISNVEFDVWADYRAVDRTGLADWVERTRVFVSKSGQNRPSTAKTGFCIISRKMMLPDQGWAYSIDFGGIRVDCRTGDRTEFAA